VTNGTTNVFAGKFIVLNRRSGFDFPGQALGVCQFVRPSLGKSQCPAQCSKQFSLFASEDVLLEPDCYSIVAAKVGDEEVDFKGCVAAKHVVRVISASLPGIAAVDGLLRANAAAMKFAVKNVTEGVVKISAGQRLLTVTCTYNGKEIQNLVSRSSENVLRRWSFGSNAETDDGDADIDDAVSVSSSVEELEDESDDDVDIQLVSLTNLFSFFADAFSSKARCLLLEWCTVRCSTLLGSVTNCNKALSPTK